MIKPCLLLRLPIREIGRALAPDVATEKGAFSGPALIGTQNLLSLQCPGISLPPTRERFPKHRRIAVTDDPRMAQAISLARLNPMVVFDSANCPAIFSPPATQDNPSPGRTIHPLIFSSTQDFPGAFAGRARTAAPRAQRSARKHSELKGSGQPRLDLPTRHDIEVMRQQINSAKKPIVDHDQPDVLLNERITDVVTSQTEVRPKRIILDRDPMDTSLLPRPAPLISTTASAKDYIDVPNSLSFML
jgi:hypothetical protein